MTLEGYYFAATGVSNHEYYDGSECISRLSYTSMPDAQARIMSVSGAEWTLSLPQTGWPEAVWPGASFPFLDDEGTQAAMLYILSANHFAIAIQGAALNGRVIRSHLRRAVLYTGLDDALVAYVEYSLDRTHSREKYGEWFPRRYVATVVEDIDEKLLALALAVPHLGIDGIEVG